MRPNGPSSGEPPLSPNDALVAAIAREKGGQRMSDQELGRRIGVSKNTIGRIMNREAPINMVRLFKIAEALGMYPEDLIRLARVERERPTNG